jgi:hypothetical protein
VGTTAGVPRLLPLAVAAAIALIPASASAATTLATPDGTLRPQPYQGWVDGSLMPTPDGTVTLSLDGCGGGLSCAPEGERSILLSPDWASRQVVLHELGHVFDDTMPAWARTRFQTIMRKGGAWASTSTATPANEQFAEAYSLCARHSSIRERYDGGYHYSPTPAQHRAVCSVIRQAAGLPARR